MGQCANDWAKTWKERKPSTFMGPGTHVRLAKDLGDWGWPKLKQEDTWTNGDIYTLICSYLYMIYKYILYVQMVSNCNDIQYTSSRQLTK